MDKFTYEYILRLAIHKEEEARDLYARTAEKVKGTGLEKILLDLSKEEQGHANLLNELIKKGEAHKVEFNKPIDLKIVDYLEVKPLAESATYQEVLIFAANEEKKAAEYYAHIATLIDDPEIKETFQNLSNWELGHKKKLETEYDDKILTEN